MIVDENEDLLLLANSYLEDHDDIMHDSVGPHTAF